MLDHLEDEITRYKLVSSFSNFVKHFWQVVEPQAYIDTKVVKVICNHLQAVHERKIRRLIINIPPRTGKTLLCSILFPGWVHAITPSERFLCYTYSDNLVRDSHNLYFKLINSPEYQNLFPFVNNPSVKKTITGNLNLAGGCREGLSTASTLTGKGYSIAVIDDPINMTKVYSKTYRDQSENFYFRGFSTRANNPSEACQVIIMQRGHEDDLIAKILATQGDQWEKLILPMEYEQAHRCQTFVDGELFYQDDRTEEGQLLIPERFSQEDVNTLKSSLGDIDASAQLQQRPVPAGGSLIKREWFAFESNLLLDYNKSTIFIRFWDLASTAQLGNNDPDYTSSTLIARTKNNQYYILDVTQHRLDPPGVEDLIRNTIASDHDIVHQIIEQEPGSSGKAYIQSLTRTVSPKIQGIRTTKGKAAFIKPFMIAISNGLIKLKKATWNENFIREATAFPHGSHDDMIDSASKCFELFQSSGRRIISG